MSEKSSTFATDFRIKTVGVVQLVRAPDCGSGGRGFEPHLPPRKERPTTTVSLFLHPTPVLRPRASTPKFDQNRLVGPRLGRVDSSMT